MTSGVLEFIAAEVAKLTRIVEAPVAPFGYGVDLSCVSDITELADEVDPFSIQALGQAIIRRLTCPRGVQAIRDPNYGIDLRAYLNRGATASELRDLQAAVRNEVLKDDRVSDCVVEVTSVLATSSLRVSLVVTPEDPNTNSFTLTLAVTDSGVLLEALE